MVRPVESIRKDLNGLGEATASLAAEFSQIYTTYLAVLGQAMRRQVILATYHLCTQVYPEEFLALSVGDRTRLQQAIQALGHKGAGWLQQIMEPGQPPRLEPQITSTTLGPKDFSRLEAALSALAQPGSALDGDDEDLEEGPEEGLEEGPEEGLKDESGDELVAEAEIPQPSPPAADGQAPGNEAEGPDERQPDELQPEERPDPAQGEAATSAESDGAEGSEPSTPPAEAASLDPQQLVQSVILAAMASEREELWSDRPFVGDPLPPTLVAKHHLMVEQLIRDVLQRVSKHANRHLRQAKILPDLPEALVEMASEADVGVPKGRSVPNVINVMVAMSGEVAAELGRPGRSPDPEDSGAPEPPQEVTMDLEADSEDEDDILEANMTHLAAVHLRLADLEFGDVQSALGRGKLRSAVAKLRKLGKQYQQAERELAIAQAEQAWRSIWYDDSSR